MQTGSEICIHTLLYLVHFLITHLHKNVGISAEFLLFFFIAQFRQLQGNQKGIERKSKKINIAANVNIVFCESNHTLFLGLCIFLF